MQGEHEYSPFNPHDPGYKKAEDLPEAFRPDFADVQKGGFARKEAKDTSLEAERLAHQRQEAGRLEEIKPLDILDAEAREYEASRRDLLKRLQWDQRAVEGKIKAIKANEEIAKNPFLIHDKGFMRKMVAELPWMLQWDCAYRGSEQRMGASSGV